MLNIIAMSILFVFNKLLKLLSLLIIERHIDHKSNDSCYNVGRHQIDSVGLAESSLYSGIYYISKTTQN